MRNYIVAVFDTGAKAYDALAALWQLDSDMAVTVHGAGVVYRNDLGQLVVMTDEGAPAGAATAIGVGLGALLGALAGPAGAAIGAGGGAAIGAAIGGGAGIIADVDRGTIRDQAAIEARFNMRRGQYAIIADVSEDWTTSLDSRMRSLDGVVYRRSRSDVRDDSWFYDYPWDYYLYPYYYRPAYVTYP